MKQNIGTNFLPSYAFLLKADLEENLFNLLKKTIDLLEVYEWQIFHLENDEESSKDFTDQISIYHPTIKLTSEYFKEEVIFLDLNGHWT